MSSNLWIIVGGLAWSAAMSFTAFVFISGRNNRDRFIDSARLYDRLGFSGVSILRCSGLYFLILAFFGILIALKSAIQITADMNTPPSFVEQYAGTIALLVVALVLLPLTLVLFRTGHPRWLCPPFVRGMSTEEVRALIRGVGLPHG